MDENENKESKSCLFDRENMLSRVTFMDSLLDKQVEIRNTVDLRTNIVIGFNAAVTAFIVTGLKEEIFSSVFLVAILGIFVVSLLFAILALKPPHFHSKKGQAESIFYHHYIENKDMEDYRKEIHGILQDEKAIYDAYITEVYNLTNYSNIPRKKYLYLSIRTLIYGVSIIFVTYGFWYIYCLFN